MKLDTGAQIPGCPELAPAACMLLYQRLGLVNLLQKRLQIFRRLIGVDCDNFTVLDACNDAAEVTVTALKALLACAPADNASFAGSVPVKAVQELLAQGSDRMAAIIAIAGTAGIYPCSNNRDLGRKNLRCKQFRGILLLVSQTLAAWMALPHGEARRQCKATRREFTNALNLQLEHTENLLCLTTEGGEQGPRGRPVLSSACALMLRCAWDLRMYAACGCDSGELPHELLAGSSTTCLTPGWRCSKCCVAVYFCPRHDDVFF
jgi:hypothetical protein